MLTLLEALRPRQWTKNLILLAPLLFAEKLGDRALTLRAVIGMTPNMYDGIDGPLADVDARRLIFLEGEVAVDSITLREFYEGSFQTYGWSTSVSHWGGSSGSRTTIEAQNADQAAVFLNIKEVQGGSQVFFAALRP